MTSNHEFWGHPLQEVQAFVRLQLFFFHSCPPEFWNSSVKQSLESLAPCTPCKRCHHGGPPWILPRPQVDWTHHASPSRTLYLQVWHLQVICPRLIISKSRHICSRAAELSIELNASERIQLKDAQGSSRIYDLCKDRAGGLVLHLLANRAHLCQHLLPLCLSG